MIENENINTGGLDLDSSKNQLKKGKLTYALNATTESFNDTMVKYQNELGNEFCLKFPEGYLLIGNRYIQEKNKHIFMLANPTTGDSEIGYMQNNDCKYRKLVNDKCLNFSILHPIHKIVHRVTNCTTEIYWTDAFNERRFLDIDNIPYKLTEISDPACNDNYTDELDCNQLRVQPDFAIPQIDVKEIVNVGVLEAGTYQFAVQYADINGNELTSYYSVTNPTPIYDSQITTKDFNYEVGRSIVLEISNLDFTGLYEYFNLAVIKTINSISSVELVGTYPVDNKVKKITYTGENSNTDIKLSLQDIFEKFPYYNIADDITTAGDVLIWKGLTEIDRINYQSIANQITLKWQTYRLPDNYENELNSTHFKGYMRDEVYAFEIVFLLNNGKQTDGFHIPGRIKNQNEDRPDVATINLDGSKNVNFVGTPDYYIGEIGYSSYWKQFNTASVTQTEPEFENTPDYKGPYQVGEFAYWESEETYPCNELIWGELAGKKIRHHKFPDVAISPIIENGPVTYEGDKIIPVMQDVAVFPIGVKIDPQQIRDLILTSNLTEQQKNDIVGYKIVRGNRTTNKSIIAKGMLRNVNKYTRENQEYYYPNYPYNDLNEDPFILEQNNSYKGETQPWLITCEETEGTNASSTEENECSPVNTLDNSSATLYEGETRGVYEYTDPNTGKISVGYLEQGETVEIVSVTRPTALKGVMYIGPGNYDVWYIEKRTGKAGFREAWYDPYTINNSNFEYRNPWLKNRGKTYKSIYPTHAEDNRPDGYPTNFTTNFNNAYARVNVCDFSACNPDKDGELCGSGRRVVKLLDTITAEPGQVLRPSVGSRRSSLNFDYNNIKGVSAKNTNYQVFNSPDTSFVQPTLGNVLKLESVMYGGGKAHFVPVKDNAKYKMISKEAQLDALETAANIASITDFNPAVFYSAFEASLTIIQNAITSRNYAMSFNSVADYNYQNPISNTEIKQVNVDKIQYTIPYVQTIGDIKLNNWYRETSVFLKLKDNLPFPTEVESIQNNGGVPFIEDNSRFTIGDRGLCNAPESEQDITVLSYYASIKNIRNDQWGQIYSYETIDTGFQNLVTDNKESVFGGDTFITRFGFKTKLPYFIDNRVNGMDDSDIYYDEIGNVGYPKYWHSARSILEDYTASGNRLLNIISYKAHNLDCPNDPSSIPSGTLRNYYDGYFYLFAYGIPYFYCESGINVPLRQAFDNKDGDFYPHVGEGIPDDWLQETNVPIAFRNSYYYNKTFSKQNKENAFSHLPFDWDETACFTAYPFRAIYSDPQLTSVDSRINNWKIYRALSYYDFPQNYGNLTAIDGIQNKAVLARFENKALLYNSLLTIDTSNPQAAYIGNPKMFSNPPIDYAETDLGYVGSQHKFLLKIPQGQITVDSKRGQIFLLTGKGAQDLTAFGSGVNKFMRNHLDFEILEYFEDVDIDNHFNGIGLHGVYDSKFERLILTKIDFIPLDERIVHKNGKYYIDDVEVFLYQRDYFCNRSFTISFDFNLNSWLSFHTYIPNFYIGENNFFYSGTNACCEDLQIEIDLIVGEIDNTLTTTTTTSKPDDLVTTTTTTETPKDCTLANASVTITDCVLEGNAVVTVPATTTTTLCTRPANLVTFNFIEGYELDGQPVQVTTGDLYTANNAAVFLSSNEDVLTINFNVQGFSLNVGNTLYYSEYSNDCTLVPTGWYITGDPFSYKIIHVIDGIIQEIVENINAGIPYDLDCEGFIVYNNNNYTLFQEETPTPLSLELNNSPIGMAITEKLLYTVNGTTLHKYNNGLNYEYPVVYTLPFSVNSGIGVQEEDLLLLINNTTRELVVYDVVNNTTTTKFTLPVGYQGVSNILYNGQQVLLVAFDSTNYRLLQYHIDTGTLEADRVLNNNITNIFLDENQLYLLSSTGDFYSYENISPYTETLIENLGTIITAFAQLNSCLNRFNFVEITTTTTTVAPTTTTTTTVLGACNEYEIIGPRAFYYYDCFGIQRSLSVPTGDSISVCASQPISNAILIGPCNEKGLI